MSSHTRRAGSGPRQADRLYRTALTLVSQRGFEAVTIEGIAAAAGVNKTTIYRWWTTKEALVSDALIHSSTLELTIADTGTLRSDLLSLLGQVRTLMTDEATGRLVTSVFAAAASHDELAEVARAFFSDRLVRETAIFERAIARGELAADTDVTTAIDMVIGALWVRIMLRQIDVDADFDAQIVDLALAGLKPRLGVFGSRSWLDGCAVRHRFRFNAEERCPLSGIVSDFHSRLKDTFSTFEDRNCRPGSIS